MAPPNTACSCSTADFGLAGLAGAAAPGHDAAEPIAGLVEDDGVSRPRRAGTAERSLAATAAIDSGAEGTPS